MSPGVDSVNLNKLADTGQTPLKVVLPPSKLNNAPRDDIEDDIEKLRCQTESETDNNRTDDCDRLNVEEFECDVSVQGNDKQEWSFTFYDFDGRGKITKEDVASLMRSLYEAVGTSVRLLPNGMKSLKFRLTVSPDGKLEKPDLSGTKLNNLSLSEERNTTSKLSPETHQKLVEMVQKNMAKQRRAPKKKHNNEHRNSSHHEKTRKTTVSYHCHESKDRRNYYADLAGCESNNNDPEAELLLQNHDLPHSVLHKAEKSKHSSDHTSRHHRSRSHETGKKENAPMERYLRLLEETQEYGRSRSHDPQETPVRPRTHRQSSASKATKTRPISVAAKGDGEEKTSPLHRRHHKHKQEKEKDKKLAMKQVTEWLEKEDLWGTKDTISTNVNSETVIVQKHEHHHIHEHHHHYHYHHYYET